MKYGIALGFLLFASSALATEHNSPAEFTVSCNDHGAVVVLGRGTAEPGATYYVGKMCDAYRPGFGAGRWWYAASAFIVEIDGRVIRFNGDLNCDATPYCAPQ